MDTLESLTSALGGRYRIERELGRGGMATVYLAQDLRQDRKMALKLLPAAPCRSRARCGVRET